jgi:hypothetical protein
MAIINPYARRGRPRCVALPILAERPAAPDDGPPDPVANEPASHAHDGAYPARGPCTLSVSAPYTPLDF